MARTSPISPSKKITYPPEWTDGERMSYLLSPFPPSAKPLKLNDPKFSFWSSLILSSSKELREAITSVRVLKERFSWNGRAIPGCLVDVLEGMERNGDAMKVSEFYNVDRGWLSWSADVLVKKPISWALKSYLPANTYEGEYVINCVAKDSAVAVMDKFQKTVLYKSTDTIMKSSDFEKLCLGIVSRESVPIVKYQLQLDGKLARRETEFGFEVVKLCLAKERGMEVTDMDIGIVRIKESIEDLSEQIKAMETAIDSLRLSAKEKVHSKDKKGALRFLRQCASKRSLLSNKESMLDNLQDILHRIQSAETDATVYALYKTGMEAVRSVRRSQGLTLERAADVSVEMRDLIQEGDEIAAVLSEANTLGEPGEDLEDRELLQELEKLMSQETGEPEGAELDLEHAMAELSVQDKEDEGHFIDQLPSVPAKIPSIELHEKPKKPQLA